MRCGFLRQLGALRVRRLFDQVLVWVVSYKALRMAPLNWWTNHSVVHLIRSASQCIVTCLFHCQSYASISHTFYYPTKTRVASQRSRWPRIKTVLNTTNNWFLQSWLPVRPSLNKFIISLTDSNRQSVELRSGRSHWMWGGRCDSGNCVYCICHEKDSGAPCARCRWPPRWPSARRTMMPRHIRIQIRNGVGHVTSCW